MNRSADSTVRFRPRWSLRLALIAALLATGGSRVEARGAGGSKPSAKAESTNTALLVDSFETLMKDRDVEAFRTRVETHYPEDSLTRILTSSPDVKARRAAALASGLSAQFRTSNAAVAKGLKDNDEIVRNLTEKALWEIWFRASTPENNKAILEVGRLLGERELDQAITKATELIAKAPDFAEAYNQRAIAHYLKEQFPESVEDCKKVLELNPYHFGALTGMAGCYRALEQPRKALDVLRQALRVRPHDHSIAATIRSLEQELGITTASR